MIRDAWYRHISTTYFKTGICALACVLPSLGTAAFAQTPAPEAAVEAAKKTKGVSDVKTESRGYYVALRGYSAIEDENNLLFENSREIAGAVGYRFHPKWRVELEYANRHSDIVGLNGAENTRGDSTVDTLGVHMFYDFREGRKIRPYLGLGAGLLSRKVEFVGTADNDPNFIVSADDRYKDTYANAFLGTSYFVNDNFRLSTGFEYVSGKDRNIRANFRDLPGINRSYNFHIGGRWFFTD